MLERGFGLRYSAFFRVSAFGIRIWAAGSGWYCPNTPFHHSTEALLKQAAYKACQTAFNEAVQQAHSDYSTPTPANLKQLAD